MGLVEAFFWMFVGKAAFPSASERETMIWVAALNELAVEDHEGSKPSFIIRITAFK